MPAGPPNETEDRERRLQRCIRDLATLNALPSMCIGRTPDEVIDILHDALPTALSSDLVYLALPGGGGSEWASLRGEALNAERLAQLRAAIAPSLGESGAFVIPDAGRIWCLEAEVPVGHERGRLVAGRGAPLDPDTDRVLIRTAANLVGMTMETADVLDAARRKDEFLAMLSHELRNPLAPILTAAELLARHPVAAREQQIIERHTRHITRLVDDLLDISRVTRGRLELRSEQVSLASVLERASEIVGPLVARQRQRLNIGNAAGITLRGDPVRLAQILGNLFTNAAKFTPAFGQIDVRVEHSRDTVRVPVRDNGRGIRREDLAAR